MSQWLMPLLRTPTPGAPNDMSPNPKHELITPDNSVIAFIDYQPQMFFGVQSSDRQAVLCNMLGLAKAARAFGVPTILSTVETKSFSGQMTPQLLDVFPSTRSSSGAP